MNRCAGRTVGALACAVAIAIVAGSARAERVVLAPSARITLPAQATAVSVWQTGGSNRLTWVHLGWPQEDVGLEIELSSYRLGISGRETVGLHYSVFSEAISNNLAPGVAVGIRDVPNRGVEGRSFYWALTKTMRLSEAGERLLGTLRVHGGYGTGRMGGLFLAATAHTPYRLSASVELVNRRTNWSANLSIAPVLGIEVIQAGGATYAGARWTVSR